MKKITLLCFMFIVSITPALSAQKIDISQEERSKIEHVIQEYLLENPEILDLAFRELQRKRANEQRTQMITIVNNYRDYLESDKNASVLGNPEGDVTIVEFFDYRCGYCRRHFAEVMKLVKEDGNIRWIPRHFPILDRQGEAPLSQIAARAAIAAHKQGKFEEFHIAMMEPSGAVTQESIFKIAENVGLNLEQLKKDMTDKLTEKQITNDLSIGSDIGLTGTPGYIIGDSILLGAEGYNAVKRAVDKARKEKTKE